MGYASRGDGWAIGQTSARPWRPGAAKVAERTLLVYDEPFQVRGVVYQPTPVGQDPISSAGNFTAYSDPRIRQRDFPLLKRLGANVIRIYQPRDILPEFFQDAHAAGLYVILGFEVDMRLDLTAEWARRRVTDDFRQFVHTWRGQPSVLMWAIGNGGNGELRRTGHADQLKAWHSLADALAKAAHEEENGQGRPVMLVSSESADIGVAALGSADAALPNLDLWGVNAYRGSSFGSLFDDLKTTKPVLITEYGLDVRRHGAIAELDQIPRAHGAVNLWNEIASRPDKAIGGCFFEFGDEWWRTQPGRPDWHEWGGAQVEAFPEGIGNLEWFGLYGVVPGGGVDRLLQRPVVTYLTSAWEPVVTIGPPQPGVWFDVPRDRDAVNALPRASGRFAGLKAGWEIFVTVSPVGSRRLFIQPEGCVVRAPSGSWVAPANLGPAHPSPGLKLNLGTLVAQTPEAAAAVRPIGRSSAPVRPHQHSGNRTGSRAVMGFVTEAQDSGVGLLSCEETDEII
jgi:hypothetical protein